MSEYQYYEFVALDHILSPEERKALRSISSRATISANSFVNEYNWGDLSADPGDMLARFFDAYLHLAAWGSATFAIRLPGDVLDKDTLEAFIPAHDGSFEYHCRRDRLLLWWTVTDETGETDLLDRAGEDGWMGRLLLLRAEVISGDLRPLYLGWLAGVSAGEVEDAALEPPPPQGLEELTPAQQALAEFLMIDPDLLVAACSHRETGASGGTGQGHEQLQAWLDSQPDRWAREILCELIEGDPARAAARARREWSRWAQARCGNRPRRTVAELWQQAEAVRQRRLEQEALARARKEAERRRRREERLRRILQDPAPTWRRVEGYIGKGSGKGYDQAVGELLELKAAYSLGGEQARFNAGLEALMAPHLRRHALIRRLREAGLWPG